jgi:hypothetical protein
MCPFIKPYKALANSFLGSFLGNEQVLKPWSPQAKKDLMVCARAAETARVGIPIPSQPTAPSLFPITCYSDAAGSKFKMVNGERKNFNVDNDRGVASIVLNEKMEVINWSRVFWPKSFLEEEKDSKGAYF